MICMNESSIMIPIPVYEFVDVCGTFASLYTVSIWGMTTSAWVTAINSDGIALS